MIYPEDKKVEIDWNDCDLYYSAVTEEYTRWARESLEPTDWPEHEKTNREVAKTAKLGLHWCDKCDMSLVGDLGKCSVCGEKGKRLKIK